MLQQTYNLGHLFVSMCIQAIQQTLKTLDKRGVIAEKILDEGWDKKEPYIFSGIGLRPSLMHLGHHLIVQLLSNMNCRGVPLVYQISNDEKRYLDDPKGDLQNTKKNTEEFLKQFKRYQWKKVYMIDNLRDKDDLRPIQEYINSKLPISKISKLFGKKYDLYRASYTGRQLAPIMLYNRQNPLGQPIIFTERDQLPFFLAMRDLSPTLGLHKPQVIVLKPLKDIMMKDKMSSSDLKKAVLLDDLEKIKKAYSGRTKEEDFCLHFINYWESVTGKFCPVRLNEGKSKVLKEDLIRFLSHKPSKSSKGENQKILNLF